MMKRTPELQRQRLRQRLQDYFYCVTPLSVKLPRCLKLLDNQVIVFTRSRKHPQCLIYLVKMMMVTRKR